MIVTLRSARVAHFEEIGLFGFVEVVVQDGSARLFTQCLPTAELPDPPGWAEIESLTQVTSAAVIAAWSEDGTSNAVAEAALAALDKDFVGQRFWGEESAAPRGTAIKLDKFDPEKPAPKKIIEAPVNIGRPVQYAALVHMAVERADPADPAFLVIQVQGLSAERWMRFQVPDANDRNPDAWWFVETFTGIAHDRIVQGWDTRNPAMPSNPVLDDAVRILGSHLQMRQVPLTDDGHVDLDLFRRELVRSMLAQGKTPFLFVGRPDHTIRRTRALLDDAVGEFLYVTGTTAGKTGGVPGQIQNVAGKAMLKLLDSEPALRGVLVRNIRFSRSGRPPKPVQPSKELIADLIEYADPTWRHLQGVVRIPTVRPDGSIIDRAGYDAETQLWYAPEFELESVSQNPTPAEVKEAKRLLEYPFTDFPFADDGAKAGLMACLLEQLVRPMISGPRPGYLFEAPAGGQGSGKTLSAKVVQAIITGEQPHTSSLGKREEEIEKRLTSLLREGAVFTILDNIDGVLNSPAIAQLLTSERWQARLLNTNEAPVYAQNATWVLTLNNAQVNKDLARRMVLVRLDAKTNDAHQRKDWTIEDVVSWSLAQRANLIRAALVLVRSWVAAGRPKDSEVTLGSFEGWVRIVPGIVKHAGFTGLSKAIRATAERDVDVEDMRELVRLWLENNPGQGLPASHLGMLALAAGLFETSLPRGGKPSPIAVGKKMAKVLASQVGRVYHGFRFEQLGGLQGGCTAYTLTQTN